MIIYFKQNAFPNAPAHATPIKCGCAAVVLRRQSIFLPPLELSGFFCGNWLIKCAIKKGAVKTPFQQAKPFVWSFCNWQMMVSFSVLCFLRLCAQNGFGFCSAFWHILMTVAKPSVQAASNSISLIYHWGPFFPLLSCFGNKNACSICALFCEFSCIHFWWFEFCSFFYHRTIVYS